MEKAIALHPEHPQAAAIESTIRDLKTRHIEAVPDEPTATSASPAKPPGA